MKCTVKGISLLEVMLSLVIGTSIIVAGVRYYAVVNRGTQVDHAISQIRSLTSASYQWLQAQSQENFSCDETDTCTAISLQSLIDAGLISSQEIDTKDPWGGDITLSPGADPTYVNISFTNVPLFACKQLSQKLQTVSHMPPPTCSATLNNYTGEF